MEKDSSGTSSKVEGEKGTPIEELLGSVTTYNCSEGSENKSQQVRTSARVFKKLKLDSVAATNIPSSERRDGAIKEGIKLEINKKPLRPTWSPEDKNLFFEALNFYGKDFEAIHLYITNKLKKKGLPDSTLKTKDQIRHFYYRTWHKISKHLKFSEGVKKIAQELYGLINYGELRKKVGSVSEKIRMKLNELMYRGSVAIRCRGKTIRVKTPLCRALRRLNQLDEKQEEPKLPTRILIEIVPKDMNSWLRVQSMAQNPRIQTSLALQKRLSSLLEYLSLRWKSPIATAYEKALTSTNSVTNECVPDSKVSEENKILLNPLLRIFPLPTTDFQMPAINLGEYFTSHSICLGSYEEKLGIRPTNNQPWTSKGGIKSRSTKRSRNESNEKVNNNNNISSSSLTSIVNHENNENDPGIPADVRDVIDEAVNTILALQTQIVADNADEKDYTGEIKMEVDDDQKSENRKETENKGVDETVKNEILNCHQGWTLNDCGTLTIGELYLMFGSDSKLTLEYSWDIKTTETKEEDCDWIETPDSLVESSINLTATLQKLLSIAKLHSQKNEIRCVCGHVCSNSNSKMNVVSKVKPISGKTSKMNTVVGQKMNVESTEISSDYEEIVETKTSDVQVQPTLPILIKPKLQCASDVFKKPRSFGIESLVKAQLDLQPKYCNRRGRRPRHNKVVVERKLPLLANKAESGHQIVQMNIISHEANTRIMAPRILQVEQAEHTLTTIGNGGLVKNIGTVGNNSEISSSVINKLAEGSGNMLVENKTSQISNAVETRSSVLANQEAPSFFLVSNAETITENSDNKEIPTIEISDNAITPSRAVSPTSISNLLDLALAPANSNETSAVISNPDTSIPSFVGLLPNSTPPSSPSRILKENDNQWINAEVADFSLSSFLGHLESPAKVGHTSPTPTVVEDSHLSQDVDANLQSLLTENSIDYMAKFADLAAQVVSDNKK